MAKKNAYSEEELISAGIMTEEGIVIDPVGFRQSNAVVGVEKEREEENLKRAEEAEKRRLEKPGLLDKMLDGIDSVKRLMQRKNEKKKEQQKRLEQKKRQQMAASRGA
ncbi:MAG: hypothetical protein IJY99_03975 [Alphaproteobacteria bacterium]|nr:hypothetical protein [Alphaproteobacteria bacterium]